LHPLQPRTCRAIPRYLQYNPRMSWVFKTRPSVHVLEIWIIHVCLQQLTPHGGFKPLFTKSEQSPPMINPPGYKSPALLVDKCVFRIRRVVKRRATTGRDAIGSTMSIGHATVTSGSEAPTWSFVSASGFSSWSTEGQRP